MNNQADNQRQYLLAALIEIYRGMDVFLPQFDPGLEREVLRDVFSAAISFARLEASRHVLSEEIHKCVTEGASVREQMQLAAAQTPDVLNAKMLAAAHLLKIMNEGKIKFS